MFATASVVLLVWLTVGWREAVVVGAAVVITLAATLFASWAWGFTINRVSLFALIFAIGILVDDAIVIVENIHRHMGLGHGSLGELIPRAVDEVGGPTILATFTVIAALLPMAFVSGLMGPYMSPIPINASMGMLISLAIALMFTPWLSKRMLSHSHAASHAAEIPRGTQLHRFFERVMSPFLRGDDARGHRHKLYLGTLAAILVAVSLVVVQWVVMKMLPFDNKSEFQVVVDMPEGTALEETGRVLDELAAKIAERPEVTDYQIYAGTAAPINFNGLVRQYYLRSGHEVGDIQVNLVDKHHREPQEPRDRARGPPGAGRDRQASRRIGEGRRGAAGAAGAVAARRRGLRSVPGVAAAARRRDPQGVRFEARHRGRGRQPRRSAPAPRRGHRPAEGGVARGEPGRGGAGPGRRTRRPRCNLRAGRARDVSDSRPARTRRARQGRPRRRARLARPLAQPARWCRSPRSRSVEHKTWDNAIYHKDLLPLSWVTADAVGRTDSPLYGMFELVGALKHELPAGTDLQQWFFSQPDDPYRPSVKWDGEWQITFETFRDMGLAYSVGLILIYLLVVAQFGSYAVPLVIMAPIPLTIIGVMPGHALLGAQFTATSMIGMIALAGIIVRNSILLVDFINIEVERGRGLADAVIGAAAVRARPIALTAVAAMTGGFFILDDPIFNGLAVSLIFGILVSTVLTLVLIPILYFSYRNRSTVAAVQP